LSFGAEYTAAVEAKQVAQQDAERAKFLVEKAEQERKSIVIKAQGEARSAKLIGDAVQKNPGFIALRRIEAARDIAQTMSHSPNRVYLSSEALLLNMQQLLGTDTARLDLELVPAAPAASPEAVTTTETATSTQQVVDAE